MSGALSRVPDRRAFAETAWERRALRVEAGAPTTAAVVADGAVYASYGDGTVRYFRPGQPPVTTAVHKGAILALASDGHRAISGGDDGQCRRLDSDGGVASLANFGSRWVDAVAAHSSGVVACSSGSSVRVLGAELASTDPLIHPSTVGGLAISRNARSVAASHYGGVTVWEQGKKAWRKTSLAWKGSHVGVTFSPDAKFIVTTMQEDAAHGWRLSDKRDMAMSGYPAKVKSLAWVGTKPWLVTSGADEAICWPFDGRDGPLGRGADTACYGGPGALVAAVAGVLGHDVVVAGFRDGAVLLSQIGDDNRKEAVIKGSGSAAVTALAMTADAWIFVGCENGQSFWAWLGEKG